MSRIKRDGTLADRVVVVLPVDLDEISEMIPLGQAKILRVLESREVFPLGARRMTKIDVRFVAATNQDLEPMIQRHTFCQDLFFRLNLLCCRH